MFQGDKNIVAKLKAQMPTDIIPLSKRVSYTDEKPVFMGHYWMKGEPVIQTSRVCCVDYSAGRGHKLCAYRWDGETSLSNDKLVWVGFSKK